MKAKMPDIQLENHRSQRSMAQRQTETIQGWKNLYIHQWERAGRTVQCTTLQRCTPIKGETMGPDEICTPTYKERIYLYTHLWPMRREYICTPTNDLWGENIFSHPPTRRKYFCTPTLWGGNIFVHPPIRRKYICTPTYEEGIYLYTHLRGGNIFVHPPMRRENLYTHLWGGNTFVHPPIRKEYNCTPTYEERIYLSRNVHGDGQHRSNFIRDWQSLLKIFFKKTIKS